MSYVVKQYFWDLSHRDPEIKGIETTIMVIMKMMLVMIINTHTHTHTLLVDFSLKTLVFLCPLLELYHILF